MRDLLRFFARCTLSISSLVAQVNVDETAQSVAIAQRFLEGQIGQIEPMLGEVKARDALQACARATACTVGVKRFDHRGQSARGMIAVENLSRRVHLRNCSNPAS